MNNHITTIAFAAITTAAFPVLASASLSPEPLPAANTSAQITAQIVSAPMADIADAATECVLPQTDDFVTYAVLKLACQ